MKDYYKTLEVPEDAGQEEIKSSFRRLAFQHHPDKNPGNEKSAEAQFKEINEAYGILGDEIKRREYDAYRKNPFAGFGKDEAFRGTGYKPEDVFTSSFFTGNIFEELQRMFSQSGLRSDEDFFNRVFFDGRGQNNEVRSGPGGIRYRTYWHTSSSQDSAPSPPKNGRPQIVRRRKPNFAERLAGKAAGKMGKFILKRAFGVDLGSLPLRGDDVHQALKISEAEAACGCKKSIHYKKGKEEKTIEVTIPAGVKTGMQVRLRGIGLQGMEPGDIYLHIAVN